MGCLGYIIDELTKEDYEKEQIRTELRKIARAFSYCLKEPIFFDVYMSYLRNDESIELRKIFDENNILAPLLKAKINELCEKREKSKPIIVARGNCCKNPCYAYMKKLTENCPECEGKVKCDFENGYTVTNNWDSFYGRFEEIKHYDDNVCDKFKFNENLDKIDYDLEEFLKYFNKVDPNEKFPYHIKEKNNEYVKELERNYIIVDGERFDIPYGLSLEAFFRINDSYFFYEDRYDVSFYYESRVKELGQSLGYYGYKWRHMVFLYKCNLCGLKYHILRTSPFAFRDKSKDNIITVERKLKQENQENQENQGNQGNQIKKKFIIINERY